MASFGFHPEALLEFAEAADFYLQEASPEVAEAFIATVESSIDTILTAPTRWRVVEAPGI